MHRKTIFCVIGLIAALAFGPARTCLAATTLAVSPGGDGVFLLQGTVVEKVGAMDLTITYDDGALGNPRVEQGGLIAGALTAVNTSVSGKVRIGIIRTTPIQGSGTIVRLTFDRKGNAAGKIHALLASLSSIEGKPLPVQVRVVNPVDTGAPASESDTAVAAQPASGEKTPAASAPSAAEAAPQLAPSTRVVVGGIAGPVSAGGTSEPADSTASGETDELALTAEPDVDAAERPETTAREAGGEAAPQPAAPEREIHSLQSILDRFRDFTGERTADAFMALFEQDGAGGVSQDPSPVIADGKNLLQVVFISEPGDENVSDVAVTGARLISVERAPGDAYTWIVKLQPETGADEASLAVPLAKLTIVFPLAVAPRRDIDLDRSGAVTPADFSLFLKKRTGFDLNGDGKRDYRDDYIFTANYLAAVPEREKASAETPR